MSIFHVGRAQEKLHSIVSYSLGMTSVSLTENPSTLQSSDTTTSTTTTTTTEAASAAVSAISLDFAYEVAMTEKRSYFVRGIVTAMASGGSGFYLLGGGMNFYLNDLCTKFSYESAGMEMTVLPKFKYYWGFDTGIGYLVYNTESKKRSDIFFDLGLHLGLGMGLGEKWGFKLEVGGARGTGVLTTSINIKAYLGATYYL